MRLGHIISAPFRAVGRLVSSPSEGEPDGATPSRANASELPSRSPVSRDGDVLLDWKASKKTWNCHWFPLAPSNGDPEKINLYAPGGALDKYDRATGASARAYEAQHNSVTTRSRNAGWAGHCNNASQIACLLPEPKHAVQYRGQVFTPTDIAGLLVSVSDNLLAGAVDFCGKRSFGWWSRDNDPSPDKTLDQIREWAPDGQPFAADTALGREVWNYAYDSVKVTEQRSDRGRTLTFEVKSNGYPEENQLWIGQEVSRRWHSGTKTVWVSEQAPDFLWRPHLKAGASEALRTGVDTEGAWRGASSLNPHVRLEHVFQIYRASLQN